MIHGGRFSGKTTLVRTWLATDPCPDLVPVFVPEPASDTATGAYWAGVLSAACTSLGIAEPVAGDDPFETLCALLRRNPRPVLLALDGVQSVDGIEERAQRLLQLGTGMRLVVTSRNRDVRGARPDCGPGWTEIGTDSLAFTVDETAALCRVFGVPRDERTAEWITRRTDGLPALVAAVCAALRAEEPQRAYDTEALDELVDKAIDLLVTRLVAAEPALARSCRAVLVSATPERLTTGSLAALPQVPDADRFVDTLVAEGLLDTAPDGPLDTAPGGSAGTADEEHAWRYPEVVRASLLRVAAADHPEDLQQARAALVEYWLQRSRPDIALRHVVEHGDWQRALGIVAQHWTTLYADGSLRSLGPVLLDLIPKEIAAGDPTTASLRTLVPATGVRDGSGTHLPGLDEDAAAAIPLPASFEFPQPFETVLRLGALRMRGEYDRAMDLCDTMIDESLPDLDGVDETIRHAHALKFLNFGTVYMLGGRAGDALRMLRFAHSAGAGIYVRREAAGKLALLDAVRGQAHEAVRWVEEERRYPPILGEAEAAVRTAALVATALVAVDRLDADTAFDALAELGAPSDKEELWAAVLYARGRQALLAGVPADGLLYIDSELPRFEHRRTGIASVLIDAVRADLYLALGQAAPAREILKNSTHPLTAPTRARLLLLVGDPGGAEAIVHRDDIDLERCPAVCAELALIGSVAALRLGRRTEARRHLQRAVVLSRHSGVTRPFVTLPPSAVRDVLSLGVDLPLDLEEAVAEYGSFREIRPAVRLTRRERAVLDALLEGGSPASIAKQQYVSLNTVKTQLRSLYRKLGVHSREEAIAMAGRLVVE
ncbi:LuxR C-terminal-related transcriptional regulator [Rhodococcus sp. Z13]|uniref:LuxR C-terminal-related transcriptional regulator n=1 Tax=Rhodococcus sacchari TaxID=2962047 RepID=A0ACD4DC22_9NOCA|nr:LuxR C-terminal-related transcriptional regulator [Rhodococcus sp. Z13]UYP17639.1 LuxR C-terminal-related transcriptional regulator [Rhodococcus sp. Z13]